MGDFLVDFRPSAQRRLTKAADRLRFTPASVAEVIETPDFGLVLTYTEAPSLWAPYTAPDGTLVAIAGRIALDDHQWREGESIQGPGGLAAKALFQIYKTSGIAALERLGGNCVILLHEPGPKRFHLLTDCVGVFPAYQATSDAPTVAGSHPDAIADALGASDDLDDLSLTEFLLTSTVSPPYTYYRRIRALDQGSTHTISFGDDRKPFLSSRRTFELTFQSEPATDESALALELAAAFRNAIRRRTLRRLGRTAVALSGGLDSRAILSCIENRDLVSTFCLFDEPNRELRTAESIAGALSVPFHAWKRGFEYYGDNAELGVRIAGGMGSFANNHFLGVVDRLRADGIQNLLTGCYCDYLFKGLPLNRKSHWLTGRESLAPFRHQFYFGHRAIETPYAAQIRERLESRVPAQYRNQDTPATVFQIEAHRTFPLCYEGDNQQRVVPQRVTGWYVPVADRQMMEVYRRIPYHYKLNRSLFIKALRDMCDPAVTSIADANTGARPGASVLAEMISEQKIRLARKLGRFKKTIATDGSWPNWAHYVRHSQRLAELWARPNPEAIDVLSRVAGPANVRRTPADYSDSEVFLFVSLLTLKLWLDQRSR